MSSRRRRKVKGKVEPVRFDPEKHIKWEEPPKYSSSFMLVSVILSIALLLFLLRC